MQMLRNMALGVLPDVLRVADGPAPEAHDFLIRGGCSWVLVECQGLVRWGGPAAVCFILRLFA